MTDDPQAMYPGNIYTDTANLAGLPAGIQFTVGALGKDALLIAAGEATGLCSGKGAPGQIYAA